MLGCDAVQLGAELQTCLSKTLLSSICSEEDSGFHGKVGTDQVCYTVAYRRIHY
jgi:hypothetical protein